MPHAAPKDPLLVLRQYSQFAPWNLHDLAAVAGALLEASGVRPTNAAARARPSDRTIRYYVARGLMGPPEGRGTAATYSYPHLLQILLIKLRQMEGAQLSQIAQELEGQTGDVIERRVALALGRACRFQAGCRSRTQKLRGARSAGRFTRGLPWAKEQGTVAPRAASGSPRPSGIESLSFAAWSFTFMRDTHSPSISRKAKTSPTPSGWRLTAF